MKDIIPVSLRSCLLTLIILISASFLTTPAPEFRTITFPYKEAGLTDRQAAAHLLSRFTYGATPGEVDEVVNMGLEKWFEQQLKADLPDDSLQSMLKGNDAVELTK